MVERIIERRNEVGRELLPAGSWGVGLGIWAVFRRDDDAQKRKRPGRQQSVSTWNMTILDDDTRVQDDP